MGTAPSKELLARWNKREGALIATDPDRVPPLALPPLPDSAILGSLKGKDFDRVAGEAARTAPPRENGGNQDIKNFTKGTRVFYPVFVDGANLSFGDLHFSQGDGEITFCGAIEMGGYMVLGVDVIKDGMAKYGVGENAIFMPGTTDPQYSEWLAFSGTSVTLEGEQKYLDPFLGYQRACLHAIDFLEKFGYSRIQALMVLGTAPIEGRLSGVVDIPNACSTVYLPTAIFDIDLRPGHGKVPKVSGGKAVPKSLWKDHRVGRRTPGRSSRGPAGSGTRQFLQPWVRRCHPGRSAVDAAALGNGCDHLRSVRRLMRGVDEVHPLVIHR